LKVKRLVRKCIGTRKRVFSVFSCFWLSIVGFWKRRNFSPELILPIKPPMHICPCSRTVGISKKIWMQTYFGLVKVDSEEVFCHFAFWRHGSRLATFFIAPKNCIFLEAQPIKNLATLDPEKLQGYPHIQLIFFLFFSGFESTHCYTILRTTWFLVFGLLCRHTASNPFTAEMHWTGEFLGFFQKILVHLCQTLVPLVDSGSKGGGFIGTASSSSSSSSSTTSSACLLRMQRNQESLMRSKLPGYTSRRLHSCCPCMPLHDSVQLRCPRHATSHRSIGRRGGTRRRLLASSS